MIPGCRRPCLCKMEYTLFYRLSNTHQSQDRRRVQGREKRGYPILQGSPPQSANCWRTLIHFVECVGGTVVLPVFKREICNTRKPMNAPMSQSNHNEGPRAA